MRGEQRPSRLDPMSVLAAAPVDPPGGGAAWASPTVCTAVAGRGRGKTLFCRSPEAAAEERHGGGEDGGQAHGLSVTVVEEDKEAEAEGER